MRIVLHRLRGARPVTKPDAKAAKRGAVHKGDGKEVDHLGYHRTGSLEYCPDCCCLSSCKSYTPAEKIVSNNSFRASDPTRNKEWNVNINDIVADTESPRSPAPAPTLHHIKKRRKRRGKGTLVPVSITGGRPG